MNILVLRGGALGDFIVTLPALAALRARWPEARIELIGNATAGQLAVNRGLLSAAHSQHEARWSALYDDDELPDATQRWLAKFDIVISYWPDPDSILSRRFPSRAGQRFITAAAMPNRAPAAAHYCAALEPLGIVASEVFYPLTPLQRLQRGTSEIDVGRGLRTPPFRDAAHERNSAVSAAASVIAQRRRRDHSTGSGQATPPDNRSTAIAIHPGSGSQKKNWPAERWTDLIGRLTAPVVLIVGEAEAETWSEAPLASSPLAVKIRAGSLRIASNLSLENLVDELSACGTFLGHDSGVSHLAAACGTPCVLLFGPTDPAVWAPPAAHVRVLQHGADLAAISIEELHEAASIA